MKCSRCHGTGKMIEWVATDTVSEYEFPCRKCNGTGEIMLTNEEYIRTCSTEELVNIIVCELRNTDLHNMKLKYNLFNGNDFDAVRVWLKEKHNDTNAKGVLEWMEWKDREKKLKANMTNEEWLEQASTEEKAEFFVMIEMTAMHPVKRGSIDTKKFIEDVTEWLKQPHKE